MDLQSILLTRRAFLRLAAGAAAAGVLSACAKATPTVTPQATQAAQATAVPTTVPTAVPTAVPTKAPTTASEVTLTFLTGEDPSAPIADQLFFSEWQKVTGVNIDWQPVASSSISEKIELMLSADEATDIFIGPSGTIKQFGAEACLALDDLITQYAPGYAALLEEYSGQVQGLKAADGKMYAMCGRNNNIYMGWMYRKDVADKLGITKLETLDDWYEFMKAAKADDPNTHGVGIYGSVMGVAEALKGAYGIKGTSNGWWTVRDNKWVNGTILPEAKEAVATVAKWYQEGLIDPDMLATVEWEQGKEKWFAGKSIVGINDYLVGDDYDTQYAEQHPDSTFNIETAIPPVGPNGDRCELYNFTGFSSWGYALGKHCKDPATAMRFLDFIFTDEGIVLYSIGKEGVTFTKSGDTYTFIPEQRDLVEQTIKEDGISLTYAMWKLYGIGFPFFSCKAYPAPEPYNSALIGFTITEKMAAAQALSGQYMEDKVLSPSFTQAEQDELTTLNADLNTYREETWVSMIKGDTSLDQWDTYVEQAKGMNIERVVEIWNTASERG